MRLEAVPITITDAKLFVKRHHRHHKPPTGGLWAAAVAMGGEIVGVAIASRPTARMSQDGWTIEVVRTCTDGTRNANSKLYGMCCRVAAALGYQRVLTYTLPSESGESLRAAGFTMIGKAGGGSWSRESRPRVDKHPLQQKLKWQKDVDAT